MAIVVGLKSNAREVFLTN